MKNLKKGLAVAMSLAMIATVVPATKVNAAGTACTVYGTTVVAAEDAVDALGDLTTLTTESTIGTAKTPVLEALASAKTALDNVLTCTELTAADVRAYNKDLKEVKALITLLGAADVAGSILESIKTAKISDLINDTGVDTDDKAQEKIDAIDEMLKFYEDNADHMTTAQAREVRTATRKLETAKTNFGKLLTATTSTVAETKIKDLTKDKMDTLTSTIDRLDQALDNLDAVNEYVEKLSTTVQNNYKVKKAITAAEEQVELLQDAVDVMEKIEDYIYGTNANIYEDIINNLATNDIDVTDDNAEDITLTADPKDYSSAILAEFDKVLNLTENFFEVDATTTGNRVKVTKYYFGKGDLYDVLGGDEVDAYGELVAAIYLTTGKTEANLEEVNELVAKIMKATKITDEIEDIYTEITTTYKELLTDKEMADVVTKYYQLKYGKVQAGWIDLGNGNWDFFNADGSVATKWVAAGKDWYYVKASHMLRNSWVAQDASGAVWYYVDNAGKMVTNTTVDGYVINANGEWHK